MKQLLVSAIENGTVIDHIPPATVFKLVEVLQAGSSRDEVLIGMNLTSRKLGHKGVIKLSNQVLNTATLRKIALLAAGSTIITIKDYQVVRKQTVTIPDSVTDIVRCINPNCITNHEQAVTRFSILTKQPVMLQCHYCEKVIDEAQLSFR